MGKIFSMTGFASVQAEYNNSEISCEIRSLNSRYLEISVRVPRILNDLEKDLKDTIRKEITRGKILYNLNFSSLDSDIQNLKIDPAAVKTYMDLLSQIRDAAGLNSDIKIDHLLFFKDVISFEEDHKIDEQTSNFLFDLTEKTLDHLKEMRAHEGEHLRKDLQKRLEKIKKLSDDIARLGKSNARKEFDRLSQRLDALIGEGKVDSSRMEQELAILADKVDITEETVRLLSHIELFQKNLKKGSPIGKKLNFILQEMNRETNTISNKSTMVEISHLVVSLKQEIEKIREQVQNIE